jgi:hypothetical protein
LGKRLLLKHLVQVLFSDVFGNAKQVNSSGVEMKIDHGHEIAFVREIWGRAVFEITPRSLAQNCSLKVLPL